MADIRNDQYLHRPGAGRGAITPADPLEVLFYDGSGNPLLVKTPTGETRAALGVAGYGHDGTSWRPVKVSASGQAEVTLMGRKSVEEEVLPRAIRTSGVHGKAVQVPDGATAAVFMLYVHGRTGMFESGEGASLEVATSGFVSPPALHGYGASTQKRTTSFSIHQIFIGLGLGSGEGEDKTWSSSAIVPCVLWPGGYIYARANISGTFAAGEGMDTEMRVAWIF